MDGLDTGVIGRSKRRWSNAWLFDSQSLNIRHADLDACHSLEAEAVNAGT